MNLTEAINHLLGEHRTGDLTTDLTEATNESMRRRELNSQAGGAVLAELVKYMSYREIEHATGIPKSTVQSWATAPRRTDTGGEPTP